MLIWQAMRDAAVARHKMWHATFEGSDPNKWPLHEFIIKCVYDFPLCPSRG
jgi:hypothetical protein